MYFLALGKRKDLQTSQPKKGSRLKLYFIPVVLIAAVTIVWYTYVLITVSPRLHDLENPDEQYKLGISEPKTLHSKIKSM